jgi:hypothetical protein
LRRVRVHPPSQQQQQQQQRANKEQHVLALSYLVSVIIIYLNLSFGYEISLTSRPSAPFEQYYATATKFPFVSHVVEM